MTSWPTSESLSEHIAKVMGGYPGPHKSLEVNMERATGLQAALETHLHISSEGVSAERKTIFMKNQLFKSVVNEASDRDDPIRVAAAELLGFPVMPEEAIDAALAASAPSWLGEEDERKRRDSVTFRLFIAVLAKGTPLVSVESARTYRRDQCAPLVANLLTNYLQDHWQEARSEAKKFGYIPLLGEPEEVEQTIGDASTIDSPAKVRPALPLPVAVRTVLAAHPEWRLEYANLDTTDKTPIDWNVVLDGGQLSPAYARHDAIITRRVELDGREYTTLQLLEHLDSRFGKTFFVTGDAGDGKSTYVNSLIAAAKTTHVFLRWSNYYEPYDHGCLAQFQGEVDELIEPTTWTPIVVYSIDRYIGQNLDSHLRAGLHARALSGNDRSVVVLDGRWSDYDGVRADLRVRSVNLLPLNATEATSWAKLITRARDNLIEEGLSEEDVSTQYPNLADFIDLRLHAQASCLQARDSPLLVKLIKAVYGQDMVQKVWSELDRLTAEDKQAYCHVCLATVTGVKLTSPMLAALAPGVNLIDRANRDPWVYHAREHKARHQVIAQVLLESQPHVVLDQLPSDYADRFRLNEIVSGLMYMVKPLRGLESVGNEDATNRVRKWTIEGIRSALRPMNRLESTLTGVAGDNYDHLCRFAESFIALLSDKLRAQADDNARWLAVARHLLETAAAAPNCPGQDQIGFEILKIEWREKEVFEQLEFRTAVDLLGKMTKAFGDQWCERPYYGEIFRDSLKMLKMLPLDVVSVDDSRDLESVYTWLSKSYHRLRSLSEGANVSPHQRSNFLESYTSHLFVHLPDKSLELVEDSWHYSMSLEVPDTALTTFYVEQIICMFRELPKEERDRRIDEAFKGLIEVAMAEKWAVEPLLTMTILEAKTKRLSKVDDLPTRLENIRRAAEEALKENDSALNTSFAHHLRALLTNSPDERVKLLVDALDGYNKCIPKEKNTVGMTRRLAFAWNQACIELRRCKKGDIAVKYEQLYQGRVAEGG
ncbi:hypothetical protein LWP59_33925 [Amycolatopsis acidiphila]|uniref:Uncharacterized protein n=1 Tax=Amycolatopsis acidiphila TaxID=715473 RepID=A0A558A8X9_9PSEU|nr:hypothetical protein [Amycolatopsis acidiphila]TVT20719.1 hypothetical protein FNH06_19585 [Amycolatopsis acidiphila]UIJ59020.1 hypothetical protein LWP59_33925 [Amycolatopsis acidiphila]GHG73394.1 hypothetical protein GCM10017788_36700 [Amycolatopsis acidiphila]